MKKIIDFFRLMCNLRERMTEINETMALRDVSETYSEYVCKMNGWKVHVHDGFSYEFVDISLAFINGYKKSLSDNGLKFENGIVVKCDIANDMPCGALNCWESDIRKDSNEKAVRVLRDVLNSYGCFKGNINTIVSDFKDRLADANKKKVK